MVAKPSCTTCYLSFDHLGSVRMLTDGSGNVVARQDYLPFGEEIPADTAGRSSSLLFGASDGVEQKFTGQIRDSETGLDFFTARYYASAVGRFLSPDPANAGADPTDPQSWNAYAYVRNNPLALVDPMGLCHIGADNVAYDDEPGDCGGGSVTVVAQAPPDVMPIFVSLPSLLSDTQQPAPTAPPPAVTEAGAGVAPPQKTKTNISKTCNGDPVTAYSVNATYSLSEPGLVVGSLADLPGALIGYAIGSMFGAGVNASWIPSTNRWYAGLTVSVSPGFWGGTGVSLTRLRFPNQQSAGKVLSSWSASVNFQPTPVTGTMVMKSSGSAPVVGYTAGSRVPVAFSGGYNWLVWRGKCQ